MKILFVSYAFWPQVGGIETVGCNLSGLFKGMGHEVTIITDSEGPDKYDNMPVIRKPSRKQLKSLFDQNDGVFGNHLSVRLLSPLIWRRDYPHCILLHTHLARRIPQTWLQKRILDQGKTFAVSRFLNEASGASGVLYNGYDRDNFRNLSSTENRAIDFLFVGRIVSDKGADLFVDAAKAFPNNNFHLIGDGPDRAMLEESASSNVTFHGRLEAEEIPEIINQCRWVIIPSRWQEPFGLVAIEALACGAGVIASKRGGLPEAIGSCGILFEPSRPEDLQNKISFALNSAQPSLDEVDKHLSQFSYENQADKILKTIFPNS